MRSALHVIGPDGARRVRAAAVHRLRLSRQQARRWWFRDRRWLGRLVELRGNRVRLDGCVFDVSHPQISQALKSRLLRGRYERSERTLVAQWLDPIAPVVELGGGIGVVATLMNRRLRDPTRHVVVEANRSLISVLERQRRLNGAAFCIEYGAVSYADAASLNVGDEFISGRVSSGPEGETVPTLTLASLLDRYGWTGVTLVCDIEGAEVDLVEREIDVLRRHAAGAIIEIHPDLSSADQYRALFARLEDAGFEHVACVRKVHAFRRVNAPR